MRRKLHRFGVKFTRNWKPKLITLGLAVVIWAIVKYSMADDSTDWEEDDTRIVIPE